MMMESRDDVPTTTSSSVEEHCDTQEERLGEEHQDQSNAVTKKNDSMTWLNDEVAYLMTAVLKEKKESEKLDKGGTDPKQEMKLQQSWEVLKKDTKKKDTQILELQETVKRMRIQTQDIFARNEELVKENEVLAWNVTMLEDSNQECLRIRREAEEKTAPLEEEINSLSQQVDELTESTKQLEKVKMKLNKELDETQLELKTSQSSNESLTTSTIGQQDHITALCSYISELEAKEDGLTKTNSLLSETIEEARKRSKESASKVEEAKELAELVTDLQASNEKLSQSLKTTDSTNKELKEQVEFLQKEYDACITVKEVESKARTALVAHLQESNEKLTDSLTITQDVNSKLKKEVEDIQKAYDDCIALKEEEGKVNSSLIKDLQDSNKKLTESLLSTDQLLSGRIADLETEKKDLEREKMILQEENDASKRNTEDFVSLLENENRESTARISSIDASNKILDKALKKTRQLLSNCKSENEDLRTLIAEHELRITRQSQKLFDSAAKNAVLQRDNTEFRVEIETARRNHRECVAEKETEAKQYASEILRLNESHEKQVKKLEGHFDMLEANEQVLECEKSKLNAAIEDVRKSHDEYVAEKEEETRQYSYTVTHLQSSIEELEEALKSTNQDLDASKNVNEMKDTLIEEQEARSSDLLRSISSLEKQAESSKACNMKLKNKVEKAIKKNAMLASYLGDEKEKFTTEIKYWKDMNDNLFDALNSTNENLDSARSTNEELTTSNEKLQLKITALSEKISEQELAASETILGLKTTLESLAIENKDLYQKCSDLAAEEKEQKQIISALSDERTKVEGTIQELSNTIERLQNDAKISEKKNRDIDFKLQTQLNKHVTETLDSKNRLRDLEQHLQKAQQELKDSIVAKEKMFADSQRKEREMKFSKEEVTLKLEADIKNLKKANERLQAEYEELASENEEQRKRYALLSELLSDLKESNKHLNKVVEELGYKLQAAEKENDNLNIKLEDQQHQHETDRFEIQKRYIEIEQSLKSVEHEYSESIFTNAKLLAEQQERLEKAESLKNYAISDLTKTVRHLEQENESLTSQLETVKAQYASLEDHIGEAKKMFKVRVEETENRMHVIRKAKNDLQAQLKEAHDHNNRQTRLLLGMEKERQSLVAIHNDQQTSSAPQLLLLSEGILSESSSEEETAVPPTSKSLEDPIQKIASLAFSSMSLTHTTSDDSSLSTSSSCDGALSVSQSEGPSLLVVVESSSSDDSDDEGSSSTTASTSIGNTATTNTSSIGNDSGEWFLEWMGDRKDPDVEAILFLEDDSIDGVPTPRAKGSNNAQKFSLFSFH